MCVDTLHKGDDDYDDDDDDDDDVAAAADDDDNNNNNNNNRKMGRRILHVVWNDRMTNMCVDTLHKGDDDDDDDDDNNNNAQSHDSTGTCAQFTCMHPMYSQDLLLCCISFSLIYPHYRHLIDGTF